MNGTIITFPVQQVTADDTIQLILKFYHDEVVGMRAWSAQTYQILVTSWSKLSMSFDLEKNVCLPSNISLEFSDGQGILDDFFYGTSSLAESVDKEAEVVIKINGVERYTGKVVEGSIVSDAPNKYVKFSAYARTDIINKTAAFNEGGSHSFYIPTFTLFPKEGDVYSNNGSQFTVVRVLQVADNTLRVVANRTSGSNNPLTSDWLTKVSGDGDVSYNYTKWWPGYGFNPFNYDSQTYRSIVSILEDIYQLVDPTISYLGGSLKITHSWNMQGVRESGYIVRNDISLAECFQLIDPLYFDEGYGLSTCGDILKKLAIDWGAFTGMTSNGQAFFKQLFNFDPNNVQIVNVKKWQKGYKFNLIDYVRVTTGIGSLSEPYTQGVYTSVVDRILDRKSLPGFYVRSGSAGSNVRAVVSRAGYFSFDHGSAVPNRPTEGSVYSNNGSQFTVVGTLVAYSTSGNYDIVCKRTSGSNNPEVSGTLTKVSGSGDATYTYNSYDDANGTYTVHQARDPLLAYAGYSNVFKDHGDLLAAFWYHYRHNIARCRVDKFDFYGINYDFLKDFIHEGFMFQPVGISVDPKTALTTVDALYLGVAA